MNKCCVPPIWFEGSGGFPATMAKYGAEWKVQCAGNTFRATIPSDPRQSEVIERTVETCPIARNK